MRGRYRDSPVTRAVLPERLVMIVDPSLKASPRVIKWPLGDNDIAR